MHSDANQSVFSPEEAMRRALKLAAQGQGLVEPNPMVGAVIVDREGHCVGEGWHQKFGGPHAEVHALQQAGDLARGATLYVTLEPCSHFGKTPPCADGVIAAGISKCVIAASDPFPAVAGKGIARLQAAGIEVEVGLLEKEAIELTAPFRKLVTQQKPFVTAKWAMSLDGKLAARTGISKWISQPESRKIVHEIRGRMDGILVGIGTVLADDPLLTVRPPGPRTPVRIILDRQARLPLTSQLVTTRNEAPVLLFVAEQAPHDRVEALRAAGVEVCQVPDAVDAALNLNHVLAELGRRRITNLLVEGGSRVLGTFLDAGQIDEVHVFIAPKLIGGTNAPSPIAGQGFESPYIAQRLPNPIIKNIGSDVYIHGRLQ